MTPPLGAIKRIGSESDGRRATTQTATAIGGYRQSRGIPLFRYPTQRLEIPARGHHFPQHRTDFRMDDDICPAVHAGRLAVDNGERGAVRLCDHR
jgi:hypothetical protein